MSRDYYLCCGKCKEYVDIGKNGYIRSYSVRNVCYFVEKHKDCWERESIYFYGPGGDFFEDVQPLSEITAPSDWNEVLPTLGEALGTPSRTIIFNETKSPALAEQQAAAMSGNGLYSERVEEDKSLWRQLIDKIKGVK